MVDVTVLSTPQVNLTASSTPQAEVESTSTAVQPTADHRQLTHRDAEEQHPISAITGLTEALAGKYTKPASGIPSSDMTSAVQTSLGKADTALQTHQDISGKANVGDSYTKAESDAKYLTEHQSLSAYRTAEAQDAIDEAIEADIDAIEGKIPLAASSDNQLADKSFVNSSIATNTAYYISNNGQPFTSLAQLEAYSGTVTNNDYAFVTGTDEQGNTYYDRYKATVVGATVTWAKEYRLNNSSFTSDQWMAITSGITAVLVASYNAHLADNSIHVTASDKTSWNGKYTKPASGIPKTDLASAVQTSLGKADTAVQTAQGVSHAGEFLVVGADGNIKTQALQTWQGGSY